MQKQFFAVFSWSRKRTYDLSSREDRHLLPLETSADLLFRLQDGRVYTVLRRPTSEGTSAHVKDVADDLATQLTATAEGIKAKIGDYNWMLKTISEEERVLKDKAKETLSDLSHIFKITILFNVK